MQRVPVASDIEGVADFITEAKKNGKRMIFAVGHRAVDCGDSILAVAELLGVPIVTAQDAKGFLPEDHPQVVGVIGIFGNPGMEASLALVETADIVVSFGVDEHSQLVVGNNGLQVRRLVEIDNEGLLDCRYQAEKVLMGDIKEICTRLHPLVAGRCAMAMTCSKKVCLSKAYMEAWGDTEEIDAVTFSAKNQSRSVNYKAPEEEIEPGYCHPGRVLEVLGQKLEEDAVVCVDVGDCALWNSACLPLTKKNQRVLASMRMGTMGYSICSAIATACARPNSRIIAMTGDGAAQMATNELQTLQQCKVKKCLLIVFVNYKLGRVHNETWGPPDAEKAAGCSIENPDFCMLAEAHGGKGFRLTTSDPVEVAKVLDAALATEGLCILEVIQNPDVHPMMHKKTK